MMQLCTNGDCQLNRLASSSSSLLTTLLNGTNATSPPPLRPTNDPFNVVGTIGGTVISLIIVVGVVGNVLVLTAIVHCRQLRRSYNAFIASLSVTDLLFNVTVMPFYLDTFLHRRWQFSDVVCRWHTFFGSIVIIASSLHLALIATSRYHVIVQPRLYARWLSSSVAVVSQIVLAWIAAVAMVLPGAVGALPVVIRYSDQIGRCNYVRAQSHGAVSIMFIGGFIVPCAVMGYCYTMIWRRTRQVGKRIESHGAEMRQRPRNAESISAIDCLPPATGIPLSTICNARRKVRDRPKIAAEQIGEKIVDVRVPSAAERSSADRNCDSSSTTVVNCQQRNAVASGRRLLSIENDETNNVAVKQLQVRDSGAATGPSTGAEVDSTSMITLPVLVALANNDTSENDNDRDDPEDSQGWQSRLLTSSSGYRPVMTSQFAESSNRKPTTSTYGSSKHRKSISDGKELDTHISDDQTTIGTGREETKKRRRSSTKAQNLRHTDVIVVVTPAAAPAVASGSSYLPALPTPVFSADAAKEKQRRQKEQAPNKANGDLSHGHAHKLAVRHSSVPTPDGNSSFLPSPFRRRVCTNDDRLLTRSPVRRHRSHSLHMILAVFFAFVLTYLPFTVTNLADQQAQLSRNVYMMTSLAFWAGSCVNPLIYGIMNCVRCRRTPVTSDPLSVSS